jgi:LysW-gamma-L-lysine carboxypeptidase
MDEVALLEGLVSRYSPTGSERGAVEFLVKAMMDAGMDVRIDETGNAVGTCGPKAGSAKELLLIGHIDTVPGRINVRIENNVLYGRGSVDAKGPLAAMASAAAAYTGQERLRIAVVGAVGEEGDSKGAKHILGKMRPDLAVVGEPGGWESVVIGYKGKLSLRYSVTKPMVHPALPGGSAPDDCMEFVHRLRARAAECRKDSLFDSLSMSVKSFDTRSGDFETAASAIVDFRTPPGFDLDPFLKFAENMRGQGRLETLQNDPPFLAGKNNTLVRAFLSAIRDRGGKPVFKKKTGTADMNLLGNAWKIPILTYGPGDSNLDHTPDEHINLDEYKLSVGVLEAAISKIMKS